MKEVQGRGGFVVLSSKVARSLALRVFWEHYVILYGRILLVGNLLGCTVTISVIINGIYPDSTWDVLVPSTKLEVAKRTLHVAKNSATACEKYGLT